MNRTVRMVALRLRTMRQYSKRSGPSSTSMALNGTGRTGSMARVVESYSRIFVGSSMALPVEHNQIGDRPYGRVGTLGKHPFGGAIGHEDDVGGVQRLVRLFPGKHFAQIHGDLDAVAILVGAQDAGLRLRGHAG